MSLDETESRVVEKECGCDGYDSRIGEIDGPPGGPVNEALFGVPGDCKMSRESKNKIHYQNRIRSFLNNEGEQTHLEALYWE